MFRVVQEVNAPNDSQSGQMDQNVCPFCLKTELIIKI